MLTSQKKPLISLLSLVLVTFLAGAVWSECCPKGDLNEDCQVDMKDYAILGYQWLAEPNEPSADIAPGCGDGEVNYLDLDVVTETWLEKGSFLTNIVYPNDAGVVDVTKSPYNAYGDGVHDDTNAIQQALDENRDKIVYLPNGTYLVSDTLDFGTDEIYKSRILQGQSTMGTVIKLQDSCPGFTTYPDQAMIRTGDSGSGNNFRKYLRNLTVDTGAGNSYAIGVQFVANNNGAVVDVIIRSGEPAGKTGLDLTYNNQNGPMLIKNVKIDGFRYGVKTAGAVNSQTFEHLVFKDIADVGFWNESQVANVRGLLSCSSAPWCVFFNSNSDAVGTLVDCVFKGSGDANTAPAVGNNGVLFVRNLRTCGYQRAVSNNAGHEQDVNEADVNEFVSHSIHTLWPVAEYSLGLPIKETPEVAWDQDFNDWANVNSYSGANDKERIQAAIDSGKSTIYLPKGTYNVSGTIEIRGNVSRIVGCESLIDFGAQSEPVLKVVNSASSPDVVVIDQVVFDVDSNTPVIDNASNRTLVVKHAKGAGSVNTGMGDVFYEDVISGRLRQFKFTGGQSVWARHLGVETRDGLTHVINDGSKLWMLGYKSENPGTYLETKNGGQTEVLGHFAYSGVMGDCNLAPMYDVNHSSMSVTMGGVHYSTYAKYEKLVVESQGVETRELLPTDVPVRDNFRAIPLYVGRRSSDVTAPNAPANLVANPNGPHQVDLDWDDNLELDFRDYRVYRDTSPGFTIGAINLIEAGLVTSEYSDTCLDGSTTYYYKVTALDTWSNESEPGVEANATTAVDSNAPAAPNNLTATAISKTEINLDWDDNLECDLASYRAYRSQGSGFEPNMANRIATDLLVSALADTGLEPNTTYYYKVTAVDTSDNESAASNEANDTTFAPDITAPNAPTNLTATAISTSQINLDWDDNPESDLAGYNVYSEIDSPGFEPNISNRIATGLTSSQYPDTGLDANTTYYYKVTAVDTSDNESEASNEANATTLVAGAPPDSVAYWKFDETSGLVADDSTAKNRDGNLKNMIGNEWTTGKYNNGLSFDGTDDYVNIEGYKGITGTGSRTIAAWVKSSNSTDSLGIVTWGNSANVEGTSYQFNTSGGALRVQAWSGYVKGTTNVCDGSWHHVACVLADDGSPKLSEIVFYVDANTDAHSATDDASVNTTSDCNVVIGACINPGSSTVKRWSMDGIIDDVRIYDVNLTETQIESVMAGSGN